MRRLRVATRGSALARAQSGMIADALRAAWPGVEVDVMVVRTGVRSADDKSRFVKEIEDALLAGEADLAVHSAKDLPAEIPDGLAIVAVPERADPRDALCGADALDGLPHGAAVGTASLRRRAQLLAARPDLRVSELRGNVDTRLRRLREGHCDAIVLAAAGLARLGLADGVPLALELMVPAPGQGCLALEARIDDERVRELAQALDHLDSHRQLLAERAVARRLDAGCQTPLGAHARPQGESGLRLSAFVGPPDGRTAVRAGLAGRADAPEALGIALADILLAKGAGALLAEKFAA
jgi:hydroxymethylbilane synthase